MIKDKKYKVLILQRILPRYRETFFLLLQQNLAEHGVSLEVVYGQERQGTVPVSIEVAKNWVYKIKNKYFNIFKSELVWQPVPRKQLSDVDLIIVEQGNRLLINYYFLLIRRFARIKVAFWGHGKNMQARDSASMREKLKKILVNKVDWWFAYTELSLKFIKNAGFPVGRVSNLNNSIDTSGFQVALNQVDNARISFIKSELGITGDNVLLYCGGMYKEKKLDFLIRACKKLKNKIPDLHVILIGDGPEQFIVENEAVTLDWLVYVGAKFGNDRAPYFKISKALLMPGAVGLSLVDSFVSTTPLFTCDLKTHGPEIAYLENGLNGVMTSSAVDDYVEQIYYYLSSETFQEKLKQGCQESAKQYTLEHMIDNFSKGILKCLDS